MKNATCKLHLRVCALTREVAAALPSLLLPVAAEPRVRPSALTGRITGISLSLNSNAPILTFPEEASGVHARGGGGGFNPGPCSELNCNQVNCGELYGQ